MDEICYTCDDKQYPKEKKVKCFGPCNGHYHLSCASLKKANFDALNGCNNLLWFCNNCLDLVKMNLSLYRTVDSVNKFAESLRGIIDPLKEVVENAPKIDHLGVFNGSPVVTPRTTWSRQAARKRPRTDYQGMRTEENGLAKLTFGTKDSSSTLQPGNVFRDIYISRLSPSTTVDNVVEHIKTNVPDLTDADVRCKSLVPKDKKAEDLDFISFKVSVMEKFFEKAVDPGIWPTYVLVREFKQNSNRSKYKNFILPPPSINK